MSNIRYSNASRAMLALGVAMIAVSAASPAQAIDPVLEARQALSKGGSGEVGRTTLTVTGKGSNHYDSVANQTVKIWIQAKTRWPLLGVERKGASLVLEGGRELYRPDPFFPEDWKTYQVEFPYQGVRSTSVANQTVSPVKLCNDRLASLSGSARQAFLEKGEEIVRNDAYRVKANQVYRMRLGNGVRRGDETYTSTVKASATIMCRPLLGPKARDGSTTTTTAGAKPTGKKMEPTVKTVAMRAIPQAFQVVDGLSCPTEVRLMGLVGTRRSLQGKVRFLAPSWQSERTAFEVDGAGSKAVGAVWPVDWSKRRDMKIGRNIPGRSWTVPVTMNVLSDGLEKLGEVEKSVTLSCKPIAAGTLVGADSVATN